MQLTIKRKFKIEIPEQPVYYCKQDFSGNANKVFYAVIPDFASTSTKEEVIINYLDVTIISRDSINCFTILIQSLVNLLLNDEEKQKNFAFLRDFFIYGIDIDQLCKRQSVEQAFLLTIEKIRQNMSEEDRKFERELEF